MAIKIVRNLLIAMTFIAFLLVACGSEDAEETPEEPMESMTMPDVPEDLDTSTSKVSNEGVFQVGVTSNLEPVALNEIHSWIVHVETADGTVVEDAQITVDGGMPQHNHGFPTEPEITEELGNGDYLLEGVKFSMAGWWELKLDIRAQDQSDSITFNIVLP
jgi:hypothetical protein